MNKEELKNLNQVISRLGNQIPTYLCANEDELFEQVIDFVNLAKTKGLTVRQAQLLFRICSEYIAESTLV